MKFKSPMDKSDSTLCSSNSMISSSRNSSSQASNGGQNGDHSNISDSDSELEYSECDITLVDDEDMNKSGNPKNEAEQMFLQVMEVLRFEQEVCMFV